MRSTRNWYAKIIFGVVSALSLLVLGVTGATAATPLVKVGSTPKIPSGARTVGALNATKTLHLTIALQPQDPSGLQALATSVSTPGSPDFRQYLTVPEFAQRFGAPPLAINAVRSALSAQGMNVGTATANDLTLPVTGTAAQVEKAFSTSISQVKLSNGRTAYANTVAPALQPSIANYVQGVIGLDDVSPDQPAGLATQKPGTAGGLSRSNAVSPHVLTNGGPQPSCTGATDLQAQHGLTADEVATAYQFSGLYGAGDFGQGQTIALFEQQPYSTTDVATYQACYGTTVPVTNVNVSGGPAADPADNESALDIEQVIGLAPKASILVYQGPNTATVAIIEAIVSQDQAKVISSSYGECEALTGAATINAENTALQEAATQGQSFYISSGDSGSSMCYQATLNQTNPNTSLSVIDPGGQPFATGVGGTNVYSNSGPSGSTCPCYYQPGEPLTEGVWNSGTSTGNDGFVHASGSGGGISSFFTMPSYQLSAPVSLGVTNPHSSATPCGGSTFCREVPDVSADADPNTGYAIYSAQPGAAAAWGVSGGTSAAAPLWAAFTALANSSSTCRGLPIGFANPSLYQIAGSSYNNNFNDVTQASPFSGAANNDALGDNNGLYPVATGYDMATGLGSMNGPTLASSLCSLRAPVYSVAVTSPGAQTTTVGTAVSVPVPATDSGGAVLSYSAANLPAGLAISASTGVISGTPTTAQATNVTVTASDQFTNSGSTPFTWTIVNPPPPPPPPPPVGKPTTKSVKLSGLGKRKPKLTFTIGAGSNAPALKSVSVSLPSGFSFAKKTKSLDKGIAVRAGGKKVKFAVHVSNGVLTITFKSSVRSASLTLVRPAISVSGGEASKIRKHKIKKLTVNLRATDTSNHTIKFPIALKKLS